MILYAEQNIDQQYMKKKSEMSQFDTICEIHGFVIQISLNAYVLLKN